jgi:hypothetical protein
MSDKLTKRQEAFAWSVAMENKTNTEAYKEHYSAENMKDTTLWANASRLAKSSKVLARILELRALKQKEAMQAISWDYKQAENALLFVLYNAKRELELSEKKGEYAPAAANTAFLGAIKQLNALLKEVLPPEPLQTEATDDNGLIEALNSNQDGLWDDTENF